MRAPKGSRLRLIVRSLNEPGLEKNWNASKPVAEQTKADAHREEMRRMIESGRRRLRRGMTHTDGADRRAGVRLREDKLR